MLNFIFLILQIDVNEKLKNAPDGNYQIGLIIGTYLPVIVLLGIAWFIYWRAKNRKDLDD